MVEGHTDNVPLKEVTYSTTGILVSKGLLLWLEYFS